MTEPDPTVPADPTVFWVESDGVLLSSCHDASVVIRMPLHVTRKFTATAFADDTVYVGYLTDVQTAPPEPIVMTCYECGQVLAGEAVISWMPPLWDDV